MATFNYAGGNPATPRASANPFRVEPQGDLTGPLSGLGQTLERVGREKKQEARFKEVQGAMMEAWQSGDPDQMMEVAMQYPETAPTMEAAIGFKNDRSKRAFLDTTRSALSDPDNGPEIIAEGIQRVTDETGEPPKNMLISLGEWRRNPESARKKAEMWLAGAAPKEYAAYRDMQGGGVPGGGLQFGAQETFKDEVGNYFLGTTRRNPNTGMVESVLAPVGGGPEKPVGQVSIAGGALGLTAEEKIGQQRRESEASRAGQIEAELSASDALAESRARQERSIQIAREKAKAAGRAFTEAEQQEAALPGILEVTNQLKELAPIATSTIGGRAFDAIVHQLGFGATEGGTARAKTIALIDNQILPLLRPIFGAQFTEREGEALKKTLGDPNATDEAKIAQVESFEEQMRRNLEAKRREAGIETAGSGDATEPQEITTQAQYDALPSGTIYLEGGVKYRKP